MSDSIIQIPPDSTGKMLDTEQLTVGANTVQRQRVQLAGVADVDIATVATVQPAPDANGLAVRKIVDASGVLGVIGFAPIGGSTEVLAAPGAGLAYSILALMICNAGTALAVARIHDNGTPSVLFGAPMLAGGVCAWSFPDGLVMPENVPLWLDSLFGSEDLRCGITYRIVTL